MTQIFAIDPGTTESAWVLYDTEGNGAPSFPVEWRKADNLEVLLTLDAVKTVDLLAVEMVASYGMPVGAETFETCLWIGRFIERWGIGLTRLVYRKEVKLHLCGDSRAKDGNVRQAIIDRFGGKDKAIGRKAAPGFLYGLSGDCWQALGVAIVAAETESS